MIKNGLIVREKEFETLDKFYNLKEGALIAITGRRKVGKTTIINQFLNEKEEDVKIKGKNLENFVTLKFVANNDYSSIENLRLTFNNLKMQLKNNYPEIKIVYDRPRNWIDFFTIIGAISEKLKQNKNCYLNLIFDEVAWYSKKKDFLNAFSDCFNLYLFNNPKCKVFLSSSTGSWVRANILENKGSLYKREFLKSINLKPFNFEQIFEYCKMVNPQINKETVLEYYLMFGGIVKYYQLIDLRKSFENNIEFINKNKDVFLNERKILLESLYQKHFILLAENVLKILSKKKSASIQEIENLIEGKMLKHKNDVIHFDNIELEFFNKYFDEEKDGIRKFKIYLLCDDLVESGLLQVVNKEGNLKKNRTYILNDLFAYFEYYWETKNVIDSTDYNNWKGNAFEIFVFNHFEHFCHKLNIPFNKNNLFLNWKKKNYQIDLLYKEMSKKQNIYHVIECKYNQNKYLKPEELRSIKNKCYSILDAYPKDNVSLLLISLDKMNLQEDEFEFNYQKINFLDM